MAPKPFIDQNLDLIIPPVWRPSDWPRFHSSCLCPGSGPIVAVMEKFEAIRRATRCLMEVLELCDKFPKKDVKWCIMLFLVQNTVTTSKTNHCWHAGQVRSGQARPAHQWRPHSRAQKVRICRWLVFTCGKNPKTNPNVSSTKYHPKLLLSNVQGSQTCNTHEVWLPRISWMAHVKNSDAQANWQHALPNLNNSCKWCKTK